MSNAVSSRCTVLGPNEAVAIFRAECIRQQIVDEDAFGLDFEAVLPSPEILHGATVNSPVSEGLAVLGVALPGAHSSIPETLEGMLDLPWVRRAGITTPEQLKVELLARAPNCVAEAEAAIERVRATGYRYLSDWRSANWGVSANARDYEEISADPFCFQFTTRWSFPLDVFEALTERYPALSFDCVCIDQGWQFGGEGVFNPRYGQPPFNLVDASERLYVAVHGEPLEDKPADSDDDDPS